MPLSTIRRVERLNAKAGVYALSLSLWHGMKIVCLCFPSTSLIVLILRHDATF